jgi:diguanylate cyclase (GGDEF)-like protein/PAS domain S-box-containing protein
VSFRLKTIIGVVSIEVILALFLTMGNITYLNSALTADITERGHEMAHLLAVSLSDEITSRDAGALKAAAEHVLNDPDIHSMRILDNAGQELLSTGDHREHGFHGDAPHDGGAGHFDVTTTVHSAGVPVGTLQLVLGAERVDGLSRKVMLRNVTMALGGLVLATILAAILGSLITRPLSRLREGAMHIASGEWGYQLPVKGNDEFAETTASFNEMSRALAREGAEAAAREQELRQLAQVAEQANEAIMITDTLGRIGWANGAFTTLTGYPLDEAVGRPIEALLLGARTNRDAKGKLLAALANGYSYQGEVVCCNKNDVSFWVDFNVAPIRETNGPVEHLIIVARDITGRKEAEAELDKIHEAFRHQALHDPLTGLGNRQYIDAAMERLSEKSAHSIALLHIDLDGFKQINDTLGHAAGDHVLLHVADTLKSLVRPDDYLARVGGDEFVMALRNVPVEKLGTLAETLLAEMRKPVDYEQHLCRFGASIGIAVASGKGIDPKALMVGADIALYRAKENGRNRYEFFSERLQQEVVDRKRLADDILRGLENDEFLPFYQPQFNAASLQIVGAEALARWHHPEKGILSPFVFLKVAEDLDVVAEIDRLLMYRALEDMERWWSRGLHIPKISVNISSRRLADPQLIPSLKDVSLDYGALSFEILESIFLDEENEQISQNIAGIKALGIGLEIDDFGTGHASITSLLKLKPDRLKIDRQLISPITQSRRQQRLVKAIIEIGASQGIHVTAEGIETLDQLQMLKQLGCGTVQGFHFSRPLCAADFEQFARHNPWCEPPAAHPMSA